MSRPYAIPPAVSDHSHRDSEGAKLGMWLFLFTEILLFGGLFILYSAYRARYPMEFHEAGQHLNFIIGVLNTVILLTSSLTVVLAISAIQKGNRQTTILYLTATIVLGAVFLVNKYMEWRGEIHQGLYPNSPVLAQRPMGDQIFFGLYYSMTGLHGLHVLAGIVLMLIMLVFIARRKISAEEWYKLENAGLYWHLVDVIWIFLLPLFYLAA
jgi:cytochrome c oxidase subunit III